MAKPLTKPTVQFFRMVKSGRAPRRADRSAAGTLPTRAARFCEASTTASSLGWYIFPPIGFRLIWTGQETMWTYEGAEAWYPLSSAQFPGFRSKFAELAPEHLKDYSPPFLGALPEPGIIQIWSGLVAKTKPGWSLLARKPSNLSVARGYEAFEGVVESDMWFGPLFINIRLTRTNSPIHIDPDLPLFQVQPIERSSYSDRVLDDVIITPIEEFGPEEWADYYRTVVLPIEKKCPHGTHAATVRKRRRTETSKAGI